MPYRVTIDTSAYTPLPCSEKKWEAGTLNDYMNAINGVVYVEKNLKELYWRISYFAGHGVSETNEPKYEAWLAAHAKKNKVTFYDRMCKLTRIREVTAYGIPQGYFDKDKVIDEMRKDGYAEIPFSSFYDIRQFSKKNFKGCVIKLEKC